MRYGHRKPPLKGFVYFMKRSYSRDKETFNGQKKPNATPRKQNNLIKVSADTSGNNHKIKHQKQHQEYQDQHNTLRKKNEENRAQK